MTSDFRVDVGQLDLLARQLGESTGSMGAAMRAMETTGPKTTGSKRLDHACDDFQEKWEYGLKQLTQTVQAVTNGLDRTVTAYQQTEAALAAVYQGASASASAS
ncbi:MULTISPECIES: hypothetical protein [unclassified Kitasatospora]|uniref:hypothetical protein n=1 Tax=unclassified Kitasatospora TaxID=2633591 RepID=UPI0007C6C08B|nr:MULTISPECIES: hypothetical protein [unclassified Kitasatospora]